MIICHYLRRYFGFQYSLTKLYLALYLFFFTIGYSCNLGYISEEYDPGIVQSMDCQNLHVSGIVRPNTAVTGVNFTIPYTGGNGGIYMAQTIESKGVTGLTAILTADTLGSNSGSFSFLVSGVAQGEGDAIFDIELCGVKCTVNIPVSSIDANVDSIDCAGVTVSDSIIAGVDVTGNSFSVPYYGGNGGVYPGQTVDSEGVLGLKATLPGGLLADGSGFVTYTISGTAEEEGTACFLIELGEKSCKVSIPVLVNWGEISSMNCGEIRVTENVIASISFSGVKITVPYTGGNGGYYVGDTINSTGVTGLKAVLFPGFFSKGEGNLTYLLSGNAPVAGDADFTFNVGNQTCNFTISVLNLPCSVSTLDCGSAQINSVLLPGVPVTGASLVIPYKGGNGGYYDSQSISSEIQSGVSGLTATLEPGFVLNGDGNIEYTLSGTANSSGLAFFTIKLGGKVCVATVKVGCGAYTSPGVWQVFRCYNEGSLNESADPFSPSHEINGGYWQWGKKNQVAVGPSGPSPGESNSGPITGWITSYADNGAWQDFLKTANDPCPVGFRVPTKANWEGLIANNTKSTYGTWANNSANYTSGVSFGQNLFLISAGIRSDNIGALFYRGNRGYYLSSTQYGVNEAWNMGFGESTTNVYFEKRASGLSLRCIEQ